jgi:hypothetical protein
MSDLAVNERDYASWHALFVVIGAVDAHSLTRTLVPGLPLGATVQRLAAEYLGAAKAAASNEAALTALTTAVMRLRSVVGDEGFLTCQYARQLFDPNTTDEEAALDAWLQVLKEWTAKAPSIPSVGPLIEVARPISTVAIIVDPFADAVPEWTFLLEFAQERLVAGHVREYLSALPDGARRQVLQAVASTAASLGIPPEVITSSGLSDGITPLSRPN